MPEFTSYHDAHARAVFLMFEQRLRPLMATLAPDWMLHHIEMRRLSEDYGRNEQVEVRLVLRPIGTAREVDPDADLRTGPPRLPSPPVTKESPNV